MPADGPAGNPRLRPGRLIDDDPDRVLTPTTIFAPGSLVNPPDGAEGDRRDPHPLRRARRCAAWLRRPLPGPGPVARARRLPAAGCLPRPWVPHQGQDPRRRRVRRAGRLSAGASRRPQGCSPGPPVSLSRGRSRRGRRFPCLAAFLPTAAPPTAPDTARLATPAPGYGAAQVRPPPTREQFHGQPGVPPGYGPDPGLGPRQQAPGWHRTRTGSRRRATRAGRAASPTPAAPAPPGKARRGYASPGYPGAGAYPGHASAPAGARLPRAGGPAGRSGRPAAFPGQDGYPPVAGGSCQGCRDPGAVRGLPGVASAGRARRGRRGSRRGRRDGQRRRLRARYPVKTALPRRLPNRTRGARARAEWPGRAGPARAARRPPAVSRPLPAATTAGPVAPAAASSDHLGNSRRWRAGRRGRARGSRESRRPLLGAGGRRSGRHGGACLTQADAATAAGTRPRVEAAPEIDPALAYGPDDPAYGPPGPDWYKRDAERRAPDRRRRVDRAGERAPAEPAAPLAASPGRTRGAGHADYQHSGRVNGPT